MLTSSFLLSPTLSVSSFAFCASKFIFDPAGKSLNAVFKVSSVKTVPVVTVISLGTSL